VRIKDIHALLRIIGADGVTDVTPIMMPQWNVCIPDDARRARARSLLERAYAVNATRPSAFGVEETGMTLTISPCGLADRRDVRYFFPEAPGANPAGHPLDELFAIDTETPKQGMHHPRGVLGLWGRDIRPGITLPRMTNLDIAPTVLALLDVPIPPRMTGRAHSEAWGEAPRAHPAVHPAASEPSPPPEVTSPIPGRRAAPLDGPVPAP
jgi:hypothetical protein